ncbi:hypothetical protein EOK75_18250 (plasmid) [Pseudorhodobacter turbinis]|uniref:Uncharacterized protein n=1 Tax=Pseudorhodobacter turbinis TaxID=2500533 RepID=A0A4P8EKS0_9RHOB|nr:hypothetical protein [Pseudorhodobacter turbinis]QCO57638.1 hypothetical protein EOK75_18250 [Pseudorhodobacter turbinis]
MQGYASPEKTSISKESYESENAGLCTDVQNDARTGGEDWHKSDTSGSLGVHDLDTKNPGALAGASGAYWNGYSLSEIEYQTNLHPAMALTLAIVKCVKAGYRVEACEIISGALEEYALDMPIAPMFGIMDQASFWADMSTQDEAKAYALACYNRMTPANRAAFLGYVRRAQ